MTVPKLCLLCWLIFLSHVAYAQSAALQLSNSVKALQADPQLRHGIIGLCVVESKTGKPVFELNAQTGLAAASCQKVITSGAAFELLGKDYRYKTELGYNGRIDNGTLDGNLFIIGSGDPALGSWRYAAAAAGGLRARWASAVQKQGIKKIAGYVMGDDLKFSRQLIPGGWIWDDVGNYYGAGAGALNWQENQYELVLKSGKKPGDSVQLVSASGLDVNTFLNELVSAEEGSGDQAYLYLPALKNMPLLAGTIPINQNRFSISGSVTDPTRRVAAELALVLDSLGISYQISAGGSGGSGADNQVITPATTIFDTYLSPPLDSINYWFLKKSINLYGEALIKTIALQKSGKGATQKGVEAVKDFWSRQGIDRSAINIQDGSGLSPQNRITADALVRVMQYASSRPWFNSFYDALPQLNGLKMKSGSIGGARSFTGYSKSKAGAAYTFAIIVNNYDGSAADVVRKMYGVLDILK